MFTIRNVVLLICHGMDIKRLTKIKIFQYVNEFFTYGTCYGIVTVGLLSFDCDILISITYNWTNCGLEDTLWHVISLERKAWTGSPVRSS